MKLSGPKMGIQGYLTSGRDLCEAWLLEREGVPLIQAYI